MLQLAINPADPRYIFIIPGDNSAPEIEALEKHLNKIPQYMLLPTFNGIPEPSVFLDKFRGKVGYIYYCASGLWREIVTFCATKGINLDASAIDNQFKYSKFSLSKQQFHELVDSWQLNVQPRDYQVNAAWMILKYNLSLSELATRAGKTIIFYMIARAAKEVLGAKKILMIVPSIHLVKQGVKDLQEYKEYFNTEQIWASGEHVSMADLTIGTFQSLVRKADPRYKNYNPAFFDDYDVVCVDEAHKSPCKSIKTILMLDAFKKLKLRFGFTGTLPKQNTIEWLACQAILGPKIQQISARELIEGGYLADPIIKQFRIKYNPSTLLSVTRVCGEYLLSNYIKNENGQPQTLPLNQRQFTMVHAKQLPESLKQARQLLEPEEYNQHILDMCKASSRTLNLEQMCVMFSKPRLNLMADIVSKLHKNIIIFAHNVEYIKFLERYFKKQFPDRNVYKITGVTTVKKRQQTLDKMLETDNNILVGSFAVVGTGLTFKNVDYGIFAQSFKSDVITRQSLGRLMLRTSDKSEFYLYDIIDEFPSGKLHNQALEKVKIYKSEGHRHEIVKMETDFEPVNTHEFD